MKLKLSVLALDELEKLCEEIQGEIASRKARILAGDRLDSISQRQDSTARYAHPMRPHLQWTGRGRTPSWMNELLESGYEKESLRVAG